MIALAAAGAGYYFSKCFIERPGSIPPDTDTGKLIVTGVPFLIAFLAYKVAK